MGLPAQVVELAGGKPDGSRGSSGRLTVPQTYESGDQEMCEARTAMILGNLKKGFLRMWRIGWE